MLLSSILIVAAIFINNKFILLGILIFNILINFILKTDMRNKIKTIYFVLYFLFLSLMFQLIYINEGKVLYSIWKIYITDKGVEKVIITFLRVMNIVIASWLIRESKFINRYFKNYVMIFNVVIKLSPEIFRIIKKRMGPRAAFKYIFKKVYEEIN